MKTKINLIFFFLITLLSCGRNNNIDVPNKSETASIDTLANNQLLYQPIDTIETENYHTDDFYEFKILSKDIVESDDCVKCNILAISFASKHIRLLRYQDIYDALCTIDASCNRNIEFSEYSNEVVYQILYYHTQDFLEVVSEYPYLMSAAVYDQISNPLIEWDFKGLSQKLDTLNGNMDIRQRVKNRLENIEW